MTTELVIHEKRKGATAGAPAVLNAALEAVRLNNERSQATNTGFRPAVDADLLFALLDRHDLEKDGWKRSMSATVALLRQAHDMIEKTEHIMARQEKRIAQLESLATTDELTGLKNRRGFFDDLVRELDRCERDLSTGGLLILVDLDNFKAINDTHGHMAGDACLRLVARALDAEIRVMDTAARLGGDEFVLLLSNTTKEKAAARAQNMAWRLNNLALAWHGNVIPIQASLGLESYKKGDRMENIFNAADLSLYASKKHRTSQRRKQESV